MKRGSARILAKLAEVCRFRKRRSRDSKETLGPEIVPIVARVALVTSHCPPCLRIEADKIQVRRAKGARRPLVQ